MTANSTIIVKQVKKQTIIFEKCDAITTFFKLDDLIYIKLSY